MHPNKIGPIRAVSAPRRARPSQLPSFFHGLSTSWAVLDFGFRVHFEELE
jgi:hypothetical protein